MWCSNPFLESEIVESTTVEIKCDVQTAISLIYCKLSTTVEIKCDVQTFLLCQNKNKSTTVEIKCDVQTIGVNLDFIYLQQ